MNDEFTEGYRNPHTRPSSDYTRSQQISFERGQWAAQVDRDIENQKKRQLLIEEEERERIRVANLSPEERERERKAKAAAIQLGAIIGGWLVLVYGFGISSSTIIFTLLGLAGVRWALKHGKGKWVAFAILPVAVVVAGRWVWWVTQGREENQREVKTLVQQQRELDARTARMNLDSKRVSDSLGVIYAAKESQRLDRARRTYSY